MMRIFKEFAHFITAIQDIIAEIRIFSLMLIILMFAFANFFYVIDDNENYIEKQWDPSTKNLSFIDALLTTYFISLGDFSQGGFENG